MTPPQWALERAAKLLGGSPPAHPIQWTVLVAAALAAVVEECAQIAASDCRHKPGAFCDHQDCGSLRIEMAIRNRFPQEENEESPDA